MIFKPPHKNIQVWMKQRGQKSYTFGIRTYLGYGLRAFYKHWFCSGLVLMPALLSLFSFPDPPPLEEGSGDETILSFEDSKPGHILKEVWPYDGKFFTDKNIRRCASLKCISELICGLKFRGHLSCDLHTRTYMHSVAMIISHTKTQTANTANISCL